MSRSLLTITLIGGGLIAGVNYYVKMKKTSAELEVIPEATIHSLNLDGITIRLNLLLKNPTRGSFSIKFPFMKLTYKGALVGSSDVKNTDIKIPAYGQAKIDGLLVKIPILSIFSVSTSILKAIQNKELVIIRATMITTIDLGLINVPFEESHELTLKK
ncbi:MAG TPA: hypothetical protein VF487_13560 [Chitinophagaceae bacterium]